MQHYIFGAGGHGKVVLDALRVNNLNCDGFIDDKPVNICCGVPVYNILVIEPDSQKKIHLAIGNLDIRVKLISQLKEYSFFSVQHPKAVVSSSSIVGIGSFIAATAVIAPYSYVGNHVIVNHGAIVDHDCVIGDICHIAPRAVLGGNVKIGNRVLIGSGAIILPSITIADDAIIGAGAIVTKNISTGLTVVGNPAKILNKLC
jgi:sugar O-acyltransferase (sialic acid O-acetyltransferase NeuD family)